MANIYLTGNRAAGMTTYVAALASYSQIAKKKKNSVEIRPQNPESRRLHEMFENIILQGMQFEPGRILFIDDYPYYAFGLNINPNFRTNFTIRDFPGACFEQFASPVGENSNHLLEEWASPDTTGILILLDGLTKDKDMFYSQIFKNLLNSLSSYLGKRKIRIAVALNKCDRGEIWTRRFHPEDDIFRLYLPKTRKVLRDSFLSDNCQFFAMSIFGVLWKYDSRPNRVSKISNSNFDNRCMGVLRNPSTWQPYNIISPIYWLCTGKKLKNRNFI